MESHLLLIALDTHTERTIDQAFPNTHNLYAVVKDKVVITPKKAEESSLIYVWDLNSNHVQDIHSSAYPRLFHMDATENILVGFDIFWERQPREVLAVRQIKWATTTGQLLETQTVHLPSPAGNSLSEYAINVYQTFGHQTVAYLFFYLSNPIDKRAGVHFEYNHAVDRLTVRWIPGESLYQRISNSHFVFSAYLTPKLLYSFPAEDNQLGIYNAAKGAVTLHSVPRFSDSAPLYGRRSYYNSGDVKVFGDREVLGFANHIDVELWLFNPNFTFNQRYFEGPDLHPEYRYYQNGVLALLKNMGACPLIRTAGGSCNGTSATAYQLVRIDDEAGHTHIQACIYALCTSHTERLAQVR